MKCNAGKVDRGVRIVAGAALIVWAFMGGPVWAWIGIAPLVTGLIGYCPAYPLFGVNTCSTENK